MANWQHTWLHERPSLVIEDLGGARLGHHYVAMRYKVTTTQEMSMAMLIALRELSFLGYGQEFSAVQVTSDGKRERIGHLRDAFKPAPPSGVDLVKCVTINTISRKVIDEPAINPMTGEPYPIKEFPYYVYECESRADSSG